MGFTSGAAVGAEWRRVEVGSDFEDGINFYGDFSDEIANQALRAVHTVLDDQGTPCYCLRLAVDSWNRGHFSRFGDVVLPKKRPTTLSPPSAWSVPLPRLVPDLWTWPVLAVRKGKPTDALADPSLDPSLRDFLSRVSWQIAVRLQDRELYVGYLKLMGVDGAPVPGDRDVLRAAYFAKLHVAGIVAHQHARSSRAREEFKECLHTAAEKIASPASVSVDARLALHHVADMLTSHLGARWNRAACYWPVTGDKLRCMWAQGGSGEWSWCAKVQRPLSEEVHDVATLATTAQRNRYPLDDAYYVAAALERPIEVIRDTDSKNVLARLWQAGGNVGKLPSEYQAWEDSDAAAVHMSPVDRKSLTQEGPLAVEFNQQDPWVQLVQGERPMAPIFTSKNGRYFALPWFSRGELIAIWVVDAAYWGKLAGQPDAPSLTLSREILNALGPAMDRHRTRLSALN